MPSSRVFRSFSNASFSFPPFNDKLVIDTTTTSTKTSKSTTARTTAQTTPAQTPASPRTPCRTTISTSPTITPAQIRKTLAAFQDRHHKPYLFASPNNSSPELATPETRQTSGPEHELQYALSKTQSNPIYCTRRASDRCTETGFTPGLEADGESTESDDERRGSDSVFDINEEYEVLHYTGTADTVNEQTSVGEYDKVHRPGKVCPARGRRQSVVWMQERQRRLESEKRKQSFKYKMMSKAKGILPKRKHSQREPESKETGRLSRRFTSFRGKS